MPPTPSSRVRAGNRRSVDPAGEYVLYWMIAARRTRYNFALQRAVELANELARPLVVLEALRLDYPHASDRLHAFVIEGMQSNARTAAASGAVYYPYVEPHRGAARGLLGALAARAAVVVTDWFPAFFLPRMVATAAQHCGVRFESVDTNGLVPLADHGRAFPTARGFRSFVQRTLRSHLAHVPDERPLDALTTGRTALARDILERWPPTDLDTDARSLASRLEIDHSVPPVSAGGADTAARVLRAFLRQKLARYADQHNDPDADCTSHLSPYLHFGHIAAHEVFSAVMTQERWTTRKLQQVRAGAREGWWGTSEPAAHFLEQLVIWRELAFNACEWTANIHTFAAVPGWARATLEAHRADPRPHVYTVEQLEAADTHDPVWNAAQRQLVRDGWMHGYLRMLWGKKILEWCRRPADAPGRMEYLMNRYALDGRDPVSYLNYAWVLGRYDRPWPERPIFGTVRCMTSESARRKVRMKQFLERYGPTAPSSTPSPAARR